MSSLCSRYVLVDLVVSSLWARPNGTRGAWRPCPARFRRRKLRLLKVPDWTLKGQSQYGQSRQCMHKESQKHSLWLQTKQVCIDAAWFMLQHAITFCKTKQWLSTLQFVVKTKQSDTLQENLSESCKPGVRSLVQSPWHFHPCLKQSRKTLLTFKETDVRVQGEGSCDCTMHNAERIFAGNHAGPEASQ